MSEKERKKRVDRLAFLGTLAGGLAHEVKNPLSTMNVNLQLLKEDWEDGETPREKRTLKRVEILIREVARLDGIVNDFLNFARGFSMDPVPQDLNGLVGELTEFLDPEAQRLGIRLSPYLDPGLPPILADPKYLQRALLNLFYNAFQALEGVEGRDREVIVRTRMREGRVELELTDTGEGIPPEIQEKVFQVFYSTKRNGTGMGLPTVRRIVEELDGTLSMVSEPGKGTSFVLGFPPVP